MCDLGALESKRAAKATQLARLDEDEEGGGKCAGDVTSQESRDLGNGTGGPERDQESAEDDAVTQRTPLEEVTQATPQRPHANCDWLARTGGEQQPGNR